MFKHSATLGKGFLMTVITIQLKAQLHWNFSAKYMSFAKYLWPLPQEWVVLIEKPCSEWGGVWQSQALQNSKNYQAINNIHSNLLDRTGANPFHWREKPVCFTFPIVLVLSVSTKAMCPSISPHFYPFKEKIVAVIEAMTEHWLV